MKVFVVLYKSNCGDGTSTYLEEVFECEQEAQKYVEEREKHIVHWEWFEIIEKEVL